MEEEIQLGGCHMTVNTVVDGNISTKMDNEQLGGMTRRVDDIKRRINKGTISYDWVMAQLQRVAEGDDVEFLKWREEDKVIYFNVMSRGMTGPQWIESLEKQGRCVGKYAKSVLLSSDFQSTNGITRNIAVIKGEFFADEKRIMSNIRAEAERRKWAKPNAEIACLIHKKFTDKEIKAMGLYWIVVMHDPINDSDILPFLLGVRRHVDGSWLNAYYDTAEYRGDRGRGFAFVVPQV